MLVVCDNSTLSALAEIDLLDLLPHVVGRVAIPASVAHESRHARAPAALRAWIARPPDWLDMVPDPTELLPETTALGAGEAAAITIAWMRRGRCTLILDEKRGRSVAKSLGLPVTGLLAILVTAATLGRVDFDDALARLLATGFRLSPTLIQEAKLRAAGGSNP